MSARELDPWGNIQESCEGERRTMRDANVDFCVIGLHGLANVLRQLRDKGNYPKVSGHRRAQLQASFAELRAVMQGMETGDASGNVIIFPR